MAASFANTTTKRSTTLWLDYPENILIDPELNGRIDTTEVDDLAADIEENGQHTAVKIRKNSAGQPVLVFGHRRWRAVKLINQRRAKKGEELLRLECSYDTMTDEEAFRAAITENRFRKENTAIDDCHNIGVWQKRFKKTLDEIAEIYFPEAKKPDEKAAALKWVKDRAALVELAPEAAKLVKEGSVKVTAAVQLTRLSKDKQKEVIEASKKMVKGQIRIKTSDVIAAKGSNAKGTVVGSKGSAPAAKPAPKVTSSVYEAAENLAVAVGGWLESASPANEQALIKAHKQYRALVPAPAKRDAKAA